MGFGTRRRTSRDRRAPDDLGLAALVLAWGVAVQRAEPGGWQVPAGLGTATGAIVLARARGASWDDLGLEPGAVRDGLRLGLATMVPVGAVVAVGLAVPSTRRFFADERAAAARGRELAYHALVRIPLGTATAEELLFRSALLGLVLHRRGPAYALATTAIAFGLWHVLPALRSHDANPEGARLADRAGGQAATVAATVVATTSAGAAFAMLRLRSRSVVAPIVLHAGLNVAGFVAANWVARRAGSVRR